ncbi:23S rRNA (pseudouridine(1915)-N(3))-methyltransferase RlmH [Desulfovibrio sp. OttesenSCG-928-A18]|nr:23S rRNA (pseudouridine(1915)-N(3))-methyltransferase RlmH [Desulfovibrio sp. OttesenSCG-928-A18]
MKRLRILSVGRMRTAYWLAAAEEYTKRLRRGIDLTQETVRDAQASLPVEQRKSIEAVALQKLLRPSECVICLDERGLSMPSQDFAAFLQKLFDSGKSPCFVIGGAFGLGTELLQRADHVLSFGPMTFPHELAKVLLLEQLYRAESILAGSGYHH